MHVYTMGTRAYEEKVCAAIDEDGRLFGGRILSRDESGSKNTAFHVDNCLTSIQALHRKAFVAFSLATHPWSSSSTTARMSGSGVRTLSKSFHVRLHVHALGPFADIEHGYSRLLCRDWRY